jgi:hypothetical protein
LLCKRAQRLAARFDAGRCRREPMAPSTRAASAEPKYDYRLLVPLSGALNLFATALDVFARTGHRIAPGREESDEKYSH